MRKWGKYTSCSILFFGAFLVFISCDKQNPKPRIKLPVVNTASVSDILNTSAKSGGNVTDDGGSQVTERGVVWHKTSGNPTIEDNDGIITAGMGMGLFESLLTGLTPSTEYYLRAYAINEVGKAYGDSIAFNTLPTYSTVTDIEDHTYITMEIGTQTWMAENLRATKYNDDTEIPLVTSSSTWTGLSTPGYCWYDNDETTYGSTYGALYNWYTVNTGKLCPTGWHVPTDADWKTLEMHVGMSKGVADAPGWRGTNEGGKLKETGNTNWISPNTGATNTSAFTALPGGYREYHEGKFFVMGYYGYWWSSTEANTDEALRRCLGYDFGKISRDNLSKQDGFSVRCIKD